jgi:2-polyprenyl-6-methoxyphenol hydroxylase-like FAD-dependent oxidoreductase
MQLKIVIVGGGLGGLETALALSQDGHELLVLEAAPQFGEVPTSSLLILTSVLGWCRNSGSAQFLQTQYSMGC